MDGTPAGAEQLILVDDEDNEIGTASREDCHRGAGLRHRAFVLLLENAEGQLLLQRRAAAKLGGGRWDVSATSHVRKGETYASAAARCCAHELGIDQAVPWRRVLSYVYTECLGEVSENEFCVLFTAPYAGALTPNPAELDELRWVGLQELVSEIRSEPARYTAWLREAVARLTQAER